MDLKKIKVIFALITMIMFGLLSCRNHKYLPTVEVVDLNRYAGTWYEIARLPNSFEKGLECVTAQYEIRDDGKISVTNQGRPIEDRNKVKSAEGIAWVPDADYPGRLKVRFFWPFAGNYYIIHLDENYSYSLVGDPSRKYLWILSKTKELDNNIYIKMIETAKDHGFETEKIIKVKQDCE